MFKSSQTHGCRAGEALSGRAAPEAVEQQRAPPHQGAGDGGGATGAETPLYSATGPSWRHTYRQ